MPKVLPSKTKQGAKGRKEPQAPKEVLPFEHKVIYPKIGVNGVELSEESLKITVAKAKKTLGWMTEADYYNWRKEKDPKISREACDFGDDSLLMDEEDNKVRCFHNAKNRPFSEAWARALAQDILNHKWQFNGEAIILSNTGRVLSAQHRLIALVLAGQMWAGKNHDFWVKKGWKEEPFILSIVVRGISEGQDVISTLDNVKPRSLSDVFYTSPLFSDLVGKPRNQAVRILANALKFFWDRTRPAHDGCDVKYQTHATSMEFLDRHKKLLEHVRYIIDQNVGTKAFSNTETGLRPSTVAAACYLMAASESDPDSYLAAEPPSEKVLSWDNEKKAKRFWEEVAKDTALFKPLRMGLKALVDPDSGEDAREREKVCLLARAWALFLDDMPMSIEEILPHYSEDKDGVKHFTDYSTFGGIDWGHPGKAEKEEEDDDTPEQRAATIREENRKKHEQKIKGITRPKKGGKSKKTETDEEEE